MERPAWVNLARYPFTSQFFELPEGYLHYVDEGSGPPVVLIHGTPTWSFLYRRLLHQLAPAYRVLAPDHLGFGLSSKPGRGSYRPRNHASNLKNWLDFIDPEPMVLVVHDFGGPIGLSFAIQHPDRILGLVLMNTWMWSLEGNPTVRRASRLFGSRAGKFLYQGLNFSPRVLLPMGFADRKTLDRETHRHYLEPFSNWSDRVAPWVLARELLGSSSWYDELWKERDALSAIPVLLMWGMKDPFFGPEILKRWSQLFSNARIRQLESAGHFLMEEEPETVGRGISRFLADLARGMEG